MVRSIGLDHQVTIGQLLALLDTVPDTAVVHFPFAWIGPSGIASWRGVYADAAVGHTTGQHGDTLPTVGSFRQMLLDCMGPTYQGWKGGDYVFTMDTPLHVDNPGQHTNTEIIGLKYDAGDNELTLMTEVREGW